MEETQKVNIFRPVAMAILTGFICLTVFESCKTNKLSATPVFKPMFYIMQSPIKHDTVTLKPHVLTEQEREAMVDKFYEYGYKKFYGPVFQKLIDVNAKLELDIRSLAIENKNIRSFSRRKRDSLERTSNYYQDQAIKYQQDKLFNDRLNTAQQAKQLERSDSTLRAVNKTTKILSILGIIFGTAVLILIIFSVYLYRKNKFILQELEYIKSQLKS